jgi:hypothetical protein
VLVIKNVFHKGFEKDVSDYRIGIEERGCFGHVAMIGKRENKMGYPHHSSFEKKKLVL